jgi:geranylgeranyl diphosphate synthase, type II
MKDASTGIKENSLQEFFKQSSAAVDAILETLVPSSDTKPGRLHQAIRWSLFAGGKRFRPALVLAVGKTFGVSEEKLLSAAAAIEMIHTYSLIHDDLPAMDDDDLRRGRATCHKKFDEATAILAGDVLQTLSFQAIAEDENLSAEIRLKLISELARAAGTPTGMVAGQQLDLDAEGKTISIENLETIHQSKTGAMICAAARFGAIIAEASENELEAVSNYASHLGLLFQITDDLLDVTQTTETLGKTAGKDISASKATYPAFYGLEETRNLAESVHAEACEALNEIDKDTKLLRELVDFILNRKA